MSVRFLRSLVAIAERGSFAAAADAVRLTPSALSMQMRALEQELGTVLFERSKRPPILNSAGHRLVEPAREIVSRYDGLCSIASTESTLVGTLTIGSIPTVMTEILPRALASLRQRYPDLSVRVNVGRSEELIARLHRNELEVAIVATALDFHTDDFNWQPFAKEGFVVIAPLNEKGKSAFDLLHDMPYIRFDNRQRTGKIIHKYLRQHRVVVRPLIEMDTIEGIAALVNCGLGVSIVPRRVVSCPTKLPLWRARLPGAAPYRLLGMLEHKETLKRKLSRALFLELEKLSGAVVRAADGANVLGVDKKLRLLMDDI